MGPVIGFYTKAHQILDTGLKNHHIVLLYMRLKKRFIDISGLALFFYLVEGGLS
jgi:hypothetical protein